MHTTKWMNFINIVWNDISQAPKNTNYDLTEGCSRIKLEQ